MDKKDINSVYSLLQTQMPLMGTGYFKIYKTARKGTGIPFIKTCGFAASL